MLQSGSQFEPMIDCGGPSIGLARVEKRFESMKKSKVSVARSR